MPENAIVNINLPLHFMRLVRYSLYILIIFLIVGFSLANPQKTTLAIPFSDVKLTSYLFIFIISAFILGLFCGYGISSKKIFAIWRNKKTQENENKNLQNKIDLYESELKIYDNIRTERKKLQLSNMSKLLLGSN